ncbi:hypothetical protein AB432_005255 [Brevibacillus brevis]|uniref:Uncharacterized protein n=1 Tax=Brevibacillus brevis TaxID=1393 RepID=A0A2Z4MDP5_BREBE|nr:hypothetical protein [Brevibacillus brevis]AWX54481.1 hypothetical protein AB432_005255 [Brevibacillus brevis]
MNSYVNREIVPGERVGEFFLGCTKNELLQNIQSPYSITDSPEVLQMKLNDMEFFIEKKSGKLSTISVFGRFQGKFLNQIGLGSTLTDLKGIVGEELEYDPIGNEYNLNGITFFFSLPNESGDKLVEHIVIWKPIE